MGSNVRFAQLRKPVIAIGVFLACLLLGAGRADAQSTIAGQVTDSSGAVLPGVTVEASSPALIEGSRSAVTDSQGRYAVDGLRPGVYRVSFTLTGFSTRVREAVELVSNFTATISVELSVGALEESVIVTSEAPLVDVRRTTSQQVLTREILDVLPTGRNAWGQAIIIPGTTVSAPDVGGLGGTQQAYVSNQGSQIGDMQYQVDGLSSSSGLASGQTSSSYPDNGSFQEITYSTVGGTAETQNSGVVVNMIPKDGGNSLKGSAVALYSNNALYTDNISPELQARGLRRSGEMDQLWDYNATAGGPLKRDRVWFLASVRWWGKDVLLPDTFSQPGVPPQSVLRNIGRLSSYLGRVTTQVNQKNKVSVHFNWLPRERPFISNSADSYVPGLAPDASLRSETPAPYQSQVKWMSTISNKALLDVGYGHNHYDYFVIYQDFAAPGVSRHEDTQLSNIWGAGLNNFYSVSQFQTAVAKFSYVTGSHSFKAGGELTHAWTRTRYNMEGRGDLYQQYQQGRPYQVQVWNTPIDPVTNKLDGAVGLFLQDAWTIGRVTLNGGLRYDRMQQAIPAQSSPAGTWVPARTFATVPLPTYKDWSPRVGAAIDLFGNAKTALRASWGRYIAQDVASLAARYNPLALQSDNRSWSDVNGNDVAEAIEIGPSTNRAFGLAAGTTTPDPDLARGYNYLFNLGVQHELLSRISVSAGYYYRRYGNLTWTDNVLTTPDSYVRIDIADPLNGGTMPIYNLRPEFLGLVQNVDRNSETNRSTFHGVELSTTLRFGKGGTLIAGAASGLTRYNTCQVEDPNLTRFCDETAFDIPWRTQGKVSGNYPLPWGVSASVVFQSLPGLARTPVGSLQGIPTRPGNLTYVVTRAQVPTLTLPSVTASLSAAGTYFYERQNQFDLKFSKSVTYGRLRLEPQLGLFNLFNASTVLSQNNTFGPSLNQVQRILDGRVVRFGLQLDF